MISKSELDRRKKISETLKKRYQLYGSKWVSDMLISQYQTGKRKAWNAGLSKETNVMVLQQAKKVSVIVKNQYKTGQRICYWSGKSPWNKGLTKEMDERLKIYSDKMKENNPSKQMTNEWRNNISIGNSGKKRSVEAKNNYSVAAINRQKIRPTYSYCKGEHINFFEKKIWVRSSWEKYLALLILDSIDIINAKYEEISIKYLKDGQIRNYLVDFNINTLSDNYLIEVKPNFRLKLEKEKILAGYDYANKHNLKYLLITEDSLFINNSVTTTFSEVIQKAMATTPIIIQALRDSLNSLVTVRV